MPLAETLTQLRVGNQKFLIDFYQRTRHLFARWAQRKHRLAAPQAHGLLQDTLLDFYDHVADGRITKLPEDLRAFIYGMAQQRLAAQVPAHVPLPAAEAQRRQRLLAQFNLLGPDCQQVLTYFYFHGFQFEKMGVKMGFPNATVARMQKGSCLRKLYELVRGGGGAARGGGGGGAPFAQTAPVAPPHPNPLPGGEREPAVPCCGV
jgi:DNA-directed RNA polymerase specialized sigma24 family protein